ncbi:MAG: hypothetical protein PHZ02_15295 [Desulfocapsaceae bacterium]|nr:hypothetical protein [Desulfocapsaceae bacterium]
MIEIASVVLGIVSVLQGWRNNTDDASKTRELTTFLDRLSEIDEVFFVSKKVHDRTETFFKKVPETLKTLEQAIEGTIAPKTLDTTAGIFLHHISEYFEDLPKKIKKVTDTDFNLVEKSKSITPDIKNNIIDVFQFHEKMLYNLNVIKETHVEIKSLSPSTSQTNYVIALQTIQSAMKASLREADVIIYNCASLVSYLHVEMRRTVNN